MAENERKPRARKKASAANAASPTPHIGENNAIETAPNPDPMSASGPTTDGANQQTHDDRQRPAPTRTTIDHLHDAMQSRSDTYGEVF
jgi:hypothetical protein